VAAPVPPPTLPAQAAPVLARDWREYHRLAAQQLMRANPGRTYLSKVPEPLKGIPILEVELNADGSVGHIKVQRRPRPADAQHTTQLAIEAVRRAAPFPPVAHLPKPWSYTEVFLFDEADRFKPRTLDE
jgi:protein TonB